MRKASLVGWLVCFGVLPNAWGASEPTAALLGAGPVSPGFIIGLQGFLASPEGATLGAELPALSGVSNFDPESRLDRLVIGALANHLTEDAKGRNFEGAASHDYTPADFSGYASTLRRSYLAASEQVASAARERAREVAHAVAEGRMQSHEIDSAATELWAYTIFGPEVAEPARHLEALAAASRADRTMAAARKIASELLAGRAPEGVDADDAAGETAAKTGTALALYSPGTLAKKKDSGGALQSAPTAPQITLVQAERPGALAPARAAPRPWLRILAALWNPVLRRPELPPAAPSVALVKKIWEMVMTTRGYQLGLPDKLPVPETALALPSVAPVSTLRRVGQAIRALFALEFLRSGQPLDLVYKIIDEMDAHKYRLDNAVAQMSAHLDDLRSWHQKLLDDSQLFELQIQMAVLFNRLDKAIPLIQQKKVPDAELALWPERLAAAEAALQAAKDHRERFYTEQQERLGRIKALLSQIPGADVNSAIAALAASLGAEGVQSVIDASPVEPDHRLSVPESVRSERRAFPLSIFLGDKTGSSDWGKAPHRLYASDKDGKAIFVLEYWVEAGITGDPYRGQTHEEADKVVSATMFFLSHDGEHRSVYETDRLTLDPAHPLDFIDRPGVAWLHSDEGKVKRVRVANFRAFLPDIRRSIQAPAGFRSDSLAKLAENEVDRARHTYADAQEKAARLLVRFDSPDVNGSERDSLREEIRQAEDDAYRARAFLHDAERRRREVWQREEEDRARSRRGWSTALWGDPDDDPDRGDF